jgi:pyruvate kinase
VLVSISVGNIWNVRMIVIDMKSLVRMNFSHGEYAYHQSVIDNTRAMVKSKD